MDKRIIYATVLGVILYALLIYLAYLQQSLTGEQLLIMLITPLLIGVVSGKIKTAVILGFIISFVMLSIESILLNSAGDINIALAGMLLSLPFVGISIALAAVGGLIGKKVIKK